MTCVGLRYWTNNGRLPVGEEITMLEDGINNADEVRSNVYR